MSDDNQHDWGTWPCYETRTALSVACQKCAQPLIPQDPPKGWEDQIHVYQSRSDCPKPLSRRQAISEIWGMEGSIANEYYVSSAERDSGERRVVEILSALGVGADEMQV